MLDYAVKEAGEDERKKAFENIAREMLKDGVPVEQISKFTKLSIDEIERI